MDYNLTSTRTLLEAFSDQQTSAAATTIDASIIISTLFKATYLLLMATFGYRAFIWLLNYVQLIRVVNKIDGVPILPFIGNLHYIKSRKGTYLICFISSYYINLIYLIFYFTRLRMAQSVGLLFE